MIKNKNKHVVCGAGGFIGGHIIAALRKKGFKNIRAVDSKPISAWYQHFDDIENFECRLDLKDDCYRALKDAAFIYNLAANMGGMGFIENNKTLCMLSVLINTNLLIAAQALEIERYFFASSACVYAAEKQSTPDNKGLKEEDAYPAMPEDGYGWEKLFGERLCRHFWEDFKIQTRCARYHNVYGPLGTFEGGREKAPAAIARKVALAKLQGKHTIEIWGDGQQTRSFTYVDDAVEGTFRLMESDIHEPINIGSAEMVTINQLVDVMEDIAGVKLTRAYNINAPKGVRGRNSDNTRIKQLLGWEPSIPLRIGLEKTYEWIYNQIKIRF